MHDALHNKSLDLPQLLVVYTGHYLGTEGKHFFKMRQCDVTVTLELVHTGFFKNILYIAEIV